MRCEEAQEFFTGMILPDRTIPGSGAETGTAGESSPLNTMFIVGFALLIALLAMRLAGRGRRGR